MCELLTWQNLFELIKLGLQLLGTLFIARLAVNWVLPRFKSEKAWERQLAAYSDAVAALSEMRRVLADEEDNEISRREISEEAAKEISVRWKEAKRRVESVSATARLLLPKKTADLLEKFERDLDRASAAGVHNQYYEVISAQWDVVKPTLDELVKQGREALGDLPGQRHR